MVTCDYPSISLITVNYNGLRFLKNLFNSISKLNYPEDKIQTIMVDNGSTDGSVEFVRSNFPEVEVLVLNKNSGYAGGNNEGFKHASGQYIALINNDCSVDRNWLAALVNAANSSYGENKAGAVGSKVIFFYKYLILDFFIGNEEKISPYEGNDIYGAKLSGFNIICSDDGEEDLLEKSLKFLEGFHLQSRDAKSDKFAYKLKTKAMLAVPIPAGGNNIGEDGSNKSNVTLSFDATSINGKNKLVITISGNEICSIDLDETSKNIVLDLTTDLFYLQKDIINSCGTEINKAFYSRDRGFNEIDKGQFDNVEEIFSPSGSSLLISRQLLDDVGFFDRNFFTYYEDIDLFWRARLRGWKVFFAPDSVARHYHCGTGKEWSYSFTYHVIRNRLLMIYRCGWVSIFAGSYAAFIISSIKDTASYIASIVRGKKQDRIDIGIRFRIFVELFYLLPKNLVSRLKIRSSMKVPDNSIKSWIKKF
ncbi:MAG: glycosyltransferase [Actinobacteria bacterium]|nr:glycosyltransferase [Actinomycetota bacterium]